MIRAGVAEPKKVSIWITIVNVSLRNEMAHKTSAISPGGSTPNTIGIVNAISNVRQVNRIILSKSGLDDVTMCVNLIERYATLRMS